MIIIERFEGNIAILEDDCSDKPIEVDRALFPKNAREGDVVEPQNGSYAVNAEKTAERRTAAVARLKQLIINNE